MHTLRIAASAAALAAVAALGTAVPASAGTGAADARTAANNVPPGCNGDYAYDSQGNRVGAWGWCAAGTYAYQVLVYCSDKSYNTGVWRQAGTVPSDASCAPGFRALNYWVNVPD
ncbi:hypothetical protein ACPF8X_09655 [Streptomyces sp. G35A]